MKKSKSTIKSDSDVVFAFEGFLIQNPKYRQCIYVDSNGDTEKAISIAKEQTKNGIDHYTPIPLPRNQLDGVEKSAIRKGFHVWDKYRVNK